MSEYKGIDYGLGKTNVDHTTGIRYGVIPTHEVCQAWADSSEPIYPDDYEFECSRCGATLTEDDIISAGDCPHCDSDISDDAQYANENLEPYGFRYQKDEYICEQNSESVDIFILKSPYYTFAQFCSPCAPGACYLLNHLEPCEENESNKAYCFNHD